MARTTRRSLFTLGAVRDEIAWELDLTRHLLHLVNKPAFAGTESLAEGRAESILIGMRAAAGDLLG